MSAVLTRGERVTRVFEEAGRRWSVDKAELKGGSRVANLIPPRCAVVLALRQLTPEPLTYPVIAKHLGDRHHTAVMNLAKRGREFARLSTGYRAALDELIAIARGVRS